MGLGPRRSRSVLCRPAEICCQFTGFCRGTEGTSHVTEGALPAPPFHRPPPWPHSGPRLGAPPLQPADGAEVRPPLPHGQHPTPGGPGARWRKPHRSPLSTHHSGKVMRKGSGPASASPGAGADPPAAVSLALKAPWSSGWDEKLPGVKAARSAGLLWPDAAV